MKKRNKTIKAYEKLLRKDQDWDYSYLISLEKKKLMRMFEYFSKSNISTSDSLTTKQIGLCLRLLDIIMEEDPASKEFLERIKIPDDSFPWEDLGNGVSRLDPNFYSSLDIAMYPKYVNYRNESRFYLGKETPTQDLIEDHAYDGEESRRTQLVQYHLDSLRKLKALYLYNKIRSYYMLGWWN